MFFSEKLFQRKNFFGKAPGGPRKVCDRPHTREAAERGRGFLFSLGGGGRDRPGGEVLKEARTPTWGLTQSSAEQEERRAESDGSRLGS